MNIPIKLKPGTYVMYGFKKTNIDECGYFGNDLKIVADIKDAKIFTTANKKRIKGFKKPDVWLEFINNDDTLNNGFKFHLIRIKK